MTQKITGTLRYSYEIIAELDKLIEKNSIEIYEGFGLLPMEALVFGSPTMVSNIPIMHEIHGGGEKQQ